MKRLLAISLFRFAQAEHDKRGGVTQRRKKLEILRSEDFAQNDTPFVEHIPSTASPPTRLPGVRADVCRCLSQVSSPSVILISFARRSSRP
jgi:hypothetical protein